MRKKKAADILEPYWYNPDISLVYFMEHTSGRIEPGTQIKFKNDKTVYTFRSLVTNIATGVEWIDVLSPYGWSSFPPSRLIGVYTAKRSRAKRNA